MVHGSGAENLSFCENKGGIRDFELNFMKFDGNSLLFSGGFG